MFVVYSNGFYTFICLKGMENNLIADLEEWGYNLEDFDVEEVDDYVVEIESWLFRLRKDHVHCKGNFQ